MRYSHTFPILYGHDAASAFLEAIAKRDGEEYRQGPNHAVVTRDLVFSPLSSLMYPTETQAFEVGGRPGWEYIDTTYVNLEDDTYSEWRDFNANAYLVTGDRPNLPWRLTSETRIYLDYRVMKATAAIDSAVVEAWFSPDIPVPAGPGLYAGLPGLILMVTNPVTGEAYAAESVDMIEQPRIIAPTTGRVLSLDAYDHLKTSELADSKRLWERFKRDLDSGKITIGRLED